MVSAGPRAIREESIRSANSPLLPLLIAPDPVARPKHQGRFSSRPSPNDPNFTLQVIVHLWKRSVSWRIVRGLLMVMLQSPSQKGQSGTEPNLLILTK